MRLLFEETAQAISMPRKCRKIQNVEIKKSIESMRPKVI